jgi:hypothetical protein
VYHIFECSFRYLYRASLYVSYANLLSETINGPTVKITESLLDANVERSVDIKTARTEYALVSCYKMQDRIITVDTFVM